MVGYHKKKKWRVFTTKTEETEEWLISVLNLSFSFEQKEFNWVVCAVVIYLMMMAFSVFQEGSQ